MKLLLDVHHSRIAAERLCAAGYDVVAAADDPVLATLADEELLRVTTRDGRAVATENVRDFDRIVRAWAATGAHHAGVVFTSLRRFHRGSAAYPANLLDHARGVVELLAEPGEGSDQMLVSSCAVSMSSSARREVTDQHGRDHRAATGWRVSVAGRATRRFITCDLETRC